MKILITLLYISLAQLALAQDNWQENIPDKLKPWLNWVLKNEDQERCVPINGSENKGGFICHWYLKTTLNIADSGLIFEQEVQVEKEGQILLVNSEKNWVQNVLVNNVPVPVIEHSNKPAVLLKKGFYKITGNLTWNSLPDYIEVPDSTGIVQVSSNSIKGFQNKNLVDGRLWLKQDEVLTETQEADFLNIQVFRKISDQIPYDLETVLRINAGGRAREVALGNILLNTEAYQVISDLPAYFNEQKQLLVRLQPGTWEVRVQSFGRGHFTELNLDTATTMLPKEEIWSFNSRPDLRNVNLSGGVSVDPSISNVPQDWQNFPAYSLKQGEVLTVSSETRADPSIIANTLEVSRTIQLHDSGNAFSTNDRVNGQIRSDGRLNVNPEITLGSVNINGVDQAITKIADSEPAGVEVRAGNISLSSTGRITQISSDLSVTGWAGEFKGAESTLYLPNGYRLLHASGASSVNGSWISKWDLLDIFLVLTASVLAFKVLGFSAGALAILGLVLIEQHFALATLSIAMLVLSILTKLLANNWIGSITRIAKFVIVITVIVTFVPYGYDRLLKAIYPQLENNYYSTYQTQSYMPSYSVDYRGEADYSMQNKEAEMTAGAPAITEGMPVEVEVRDGKSLSRRAENLAQDLGVVAKNRINKYLVDPNLVQTGFGNLKNSGKSYQLFWSGPVISSETFKLYYIGPFLNFIWALLEILLAGFLIWSVAFKNFSLKISTSKDNSANTNKPATVATSLVLIASMLFCFISKEAIAQQDSFPSESLLKELKQYAVEKNYPARKCGAECVTLAKAEVQVTANMLLLNLDLASSALVGQAILSGLNNIEISSIEASNAGITYTKVNSTLHLKLPVGIHAVAIKAKILGNNASFNFSIAPKTIEVKTDQWKVSGADAEQIGEINFEREIQQDNSIASGDSENTELIVKALSPKANLVRRIVLGSEWSVYNTVNLAIPAKNLVEGQVKLLEGEEVISSNVEIQSRNVKYQIQPNANQYSWDSKISISPNIMLKAPENGMPEVWEFELTNLWNAKFIGLSPVVQALSDNNSGIVRFEPRFGEELQIEITKPLAVTGYTRTINSAQFNYSLSEKMYTATLDLNIKSSIGQQFAITLPDESKIDRLTVNGKDITSYGINKNVASFDLNPGEQNVNITWQKTIGNNKVFISPEIDFQTPAVNITTQVNTAIESWVLWVSGPKQGPVVLIWGFLLVVIIIGIILAKSGYTPFSILSATILILGLGFNDLTNLFIIFGFFVILGWRRRFELNQNTRWRSNFLQIFLFVWGVISIFTLIAAIENGLLGSPSMSIAGNNSYANQLNWFQDVADSKNLAVKIYSVPVFYFRALMLAWALWLAFSLLKWGAWVWESMTKGGGWVSKVKVPTPSPKV